MAHEHLAHITLDSSEYDKLELNDQIHVFNREVRAFESEQQQKVTRLWETIDNDFIKIGKLSEDNAHALKYSFAQAMVNLTGMIQAKGVYEADLYRKSYLAALERVKAPSRRRQFVMLQSQSIRLAHDAHDIQLKIAAVEKELNRLKSQYDVEHQDLFSQAERELTELAQINDPILFAHKRTQYLNTLMDIHETANAMTLAQRECDDYIEEAMDSGQALFNARSAYLQDKNSWMSRASDIAEKSWVGLGFGLAAVPVALCIAIPAIIGGMILAPIVAAALGIAGAAYGIVDFSRTTASLITKEITPKLGTQPFVKQKPDRLQAFKKFAKKAAPVLLCTVGAAVALAAVVVTAGVAGIILAGAGLGAASVGVGMMVKDKYDERKEIHEIRHKHKIMNEHFEAAFETEASLEKNMLKLQDQLANVVLNSTEESMNLLSGHALTQDDVEQMQGQLQQQEQESIKEKLATQAVASVSKNKIEVETNSEMPKAEEDDEGGSESDKETGKESGDTPILRP